MASTRRRQHLSTEKLGTGNRRPTRRTAHVRCVHYAPLIYMPSKQTPGRSTQPLAFPRTAPRWAGTGRPGEQAATPARWVRRPTAHEATWRCGPWAGPMLRADVSNPLRDCHKCRHATQVSIWRQFMPLAPYAATLCRLTARKGKIIRQFLLTLPYYGLYSQRNHRTVQSEPWATQEGTSSTRTKGDGHVEGVCGRCHGDRVGEEPG